MSLCAICYGEIDDGEPMDPEHLGYDGCEEENIMEEYTNR